VHFGPAHRGISRLLVPAPPAGGYGPKRTNPSTFYNSTKLDNFSSQCGFGVNETSIAQSSVNPNLIVAGANTYYDNNGNCRDSAAVARVVDAGGGQHWHYELMPNLQFPVSGDPALTYDPVRQVFLYAFVELNRSDSTKGRIGVAVSSDGVNWSREVSLDTNAGCGCGTDKPSITVDQNPSSPHYGRVIVAWTEFFGNNAIFQADHTDDGGVTWQRSASGVNNVTDECGNGASAAFNANGEAMIAWAACNGGNNSLIEALSTDGGTTWNNDVSIGGTSPLAGAEDPNPADCLLKNGGTAFRCNSFPSLAGDPNSGDAGGTAFFIVWANVDSTTQSGVTANVSQLHGLSTVDDGTTWNNGSFSFAYMANNNFGDKFFPAASFSPNGRLNVSYSTREDDSGASSGTNPNGRSFNEHQTEAGSLSSLRSAAYSTYTIDGTLGDAGSLTFIGDYAGATSFDNNFDTSPIWTDLRSGFPSARTPDLCYADCPTLLSPDTPLFVGHASGSTFQDFYGYNLDPSSGGSGSNFWNVVGLREGSDGTTVDDDTNLSPNHYFNSNLTFSSASPPLNDYTVVNGNAGHAPNTVYFPQVHSFSSFGGPYSIEWDAGHVILGTSFADGMGSSNVARVYDSSLATGTLYYVGLRPDPGNTSNYSLDLHSASAAGGSYQGRGNAVAGSGDVAPGQPALIQYNTGSDPTQYDGVVVLNNNGGTGTYKLYRDTAAPSGTIKIDGGATYTNSTTLNLTLSATNPTSGDPVSDMAFSINGGAFGAFQPYSTSATLSVPAGDGLKTVGVEYRNGAGAVGASSSSSITLDQTPPHTTSSLSGSASGCGGFFGSVSVTLTASDAASGVALTVYQVDGGSVHTYSGPFSVSGVANHTVTFHSTDHAGNVESTQTTAVKIVAASVSSTPTSGIVGSSAIVHGSNFKSAESVKVYWDSTASTPLFIATSGGSCAVTGTFAVPAVVNGAHHLIAVGQTSGQSATSTFTVVAAEKLSPVTGPVGTHVTVTLTGFKASQSATLHWKMAAGTVLATVTTNSTGGATTSFTVPADVAGAHTVYAVGSGAPTATATFTTTAAEKLSPTSGLPGAHVTATLTGFKASQSVTLHWTTSTGTTLATVTSNALGSASASFTVPSSSIGNHTVFAVGSGGPTASAVFNVT
jgi:hypothetical protein